MPEQADWAGLDHCVTDDRYFYDAGYQLELKASRRSSMPASPRATACSKAAPSASKASGTSRRRASSCKNWRGVMRQDAFGSPAGTEIKMRAATLITVRDGLISEYLDYACYAWPALT